MIEEFKAVIIDDISDAIHYLQKLIEEHLPEVKIIGTADSVVSGAKLVNEVQPALVFLDIEMPDGTGFDLIDLMSADVRASIIFTTGSEEYAIRAFRYAASDYLLKPIDRDDLIDAVDRAIDLINHASQVQQALKTNVSLDQPSKLVLHTNDEVRVVDIDDILRCQSMDNYCQFILTDDSKILISKPLKYYDDMLEPSGFFRVHQSHLVNLKHVRSFVKKEGGYIQMHDGSQVPVSFRKRNAVITALNGLT